MLNKGFVWTIIKQIYALLTCENINGHEKWMQEEIKT